VETFIGGNKGQVLNVCASLGSFWFLSNGERIIHLMNCDSKEPDIYIRTWKCSNISDWNPCCKCSNMGNVVHVV
jgi:hypothetical protein